VSVATREREAPPVPRRDWVDYAACWGMDLSLFYGSAGVPLLGRAADPGRAVCESCPVRRDCLIDALVEIAAPGGHHQLLGLRAGYLSHELRSTLRRFGWDVVAALAAHDAGTFYRHPRRKS
jgi:Transcription factor WhiB